MAAEPVRASGIELPQCEKGLGSVIVSPEAEQLIRGVRVQPFKLWPDDRGFFLEAARLGQGLVEGFHCHIR